jgi:hypothetical protein
MWIIDPAHAWLRVPTEDVKQLEIDPGRNSYRDSKFIYLDRTLDAGEFLQAYVQRFYDRPIVSKQIVEYPAFVRSLRSCGGPVQLELWRKENGDS